MKASSTDHDQTNWNYASLFSELLIVSYTQNEQKFVPFYLIILPVGSDISALT
jgi:hypothetical protein